MKWISYSARQSHLGQAPVQENKNATGSTRVTDTAYKPDFNNLRAVALSS